jgi:hypothetical protein
VSAADMFTDLWASLGCDADIDRRRTSPSAAAKPAPELATWWTCVITRLCGAVHQR